MDRRILAKLAIGIFLLAGCSSSEPPGTAARRSDDSATSAPIHTEQSAAAPTIEGPPADGFGPVSSSPPVVPQDITPIAPQDSTGFAPAPAPLDRGPNPLRGFAHAPDAGGDVVIQKDNPLRESSMPRMAAPPTDLAPPEPRMAEMRMGGVFDLGLGAGPPPPQPANEYPMAAAPTFAPEPSGAEPGSAAPDAPDTTMSDAAEPPGADEEQYDVVEVFYGTDRLAIEPMRNHWSEWSKQFLPTGLSLLATLSLGVLAAGRQSLAPWLIVFGALGTTLGLGYQAGEKVLAAVRFVGKDGVVYTTDRSAGGRIDVGRCEVTIPKSHAVGELESPSILRMEIREDAAQHVVLRKTQRLADERFYELLRQRVEASPQRELFVLVHGFNVSFEDAARRTAQIHYDLKFAGAPVFFSWPANDKSILTYPADETNVAWSAPHLKQFLLEVAHESGARSINLIAHSMGNRALAAALREIRLELRDQAKLFNQVVLAAPDIDADDFRNNIVPAMQRTAERFTLYASSRDDALLASQLLHRRPRAGDAGPGLIVMSGIDTIDVTEIDSSPWGHLYYGSSDPVLQDLRLLLSQAAPRDRAWLSPMEREGLTYWVFEAARTATTGNGNSR